MSWIIDAGGNRRATGVLTLIATVALATLALAVRSDTGVAGVADCDTANVQNSSKKQLRKATQCFINDERAKAGEKKLKKKGKLQKAARKHLKKMIKKQCFAHKCPGEKQLGKRIAKTGYFDGARSINFGENLGCAPSAKNMVVDNWMRSSLHRGNILGKFKHFGVAASTEAPFGQCSGQRGTFVVVFGFRKG